MADFATITVQKRSSTGKGANRRLRAQGIIPAVFYTAKGESVPIQVAEAPLMKLFETMGRTTVFNVEIEDGAKKETHPALIWDIEYYPTKNRFQHVDFFGVDLNKEIKIRVPLAFVGTAKGAKLGGVLETFMEFIDLVGKPLSIPNKLTVDITNLELAQTMRVADLSMPEGVHPATDGAQAILFLRDKSAGGDDDGESSEK
ncbi:50S ribosomal protein L25 [uncultured delta proteobacterium]|uniref:Large ribosomal subunit protein bL25 n=1 Tax=uncultured delta proteobacterium TaxID=34034 RepID=A0A212J4G0_9DELT|nr:50S ribosomal protein L25 [uncultured delta proteobacterium]